MAAERRLLLLAAPNATIATAARHLVLNTISGKYLITHQIQSQSLTGSKWSNFSECVNGTSLRLGRALSG